MKVTTAKLIFSFALLSPIALSTAACGSGDDVPIGQSRSPVASGPLTQGDVCPIEKCDGQLLPVCASPAGSPAPAPPQPTPTNVRCVAGPQVGSGVGRCSLEADIDCSAFWSTLKEGDTCPPEKCVNDAFACGPGPSGEPRKATNLRCIAGPQEGSGVGVCRIDGDCVPTS